MRRIIVLGSINTDMTIRASKIPTPGETVLGGRFLINPGGKGANQAVAAARLDGDIAFIAKVGNDQFGRQAKALLEQEGIHTDYIFTDAEEPSGVALIMVDEQGENCISVASGANGTLSIPEIEAARNLIEFADIVLTQLETPLSTVCRVAEIAVNKRVPVILNPAPACELPQRLYECVEVITPNESEAEILTGVRVIDAASAAKAAQALCDFGVPRVVITMGSKGAYVFDGTEGAMVAALKVDTVDTTAAGDVFNGALAVALTEQMELVEAVRFAVKAAAIAVTRLGAQRSAPYRKEVEAI